MGTHGLISAPAPCGAGADRASREWVRDRSWEVKPMQGVHRRHPDK